MNTPPENVIAEPACQLTVNKIVRILNGKKLKFTIHLLMKDGTERQLQSDNAPKLDYSNDTRCALVVVAAPGDNYTNIPVCRFDDVEIIQCEKNAE